MSKKTTAPNARRLWIAGTALTALSALITATFLLRSPPAGATPTAAAAPPAMPVSVAAVVANDVATWDEFSGRLEAVERVDIRSRVAGTVQSVHFREGALVRKGDLLITIDPAPYAADVDRDDNRVAQRLACLERIRRATRRIDAVRADHRLRHQLLVQHDPLLLHARIVRADD